MTRKQKYLIMLLRIQAVKDRLDEELGFIGEFLDDYRQSQTFVECAKKDQLNGWELIPFYQKMYSKEEYTDLQAEKECALQFLRDSLSASNDPSVDHRTCLYNLAQSLHSDMEDQLDTFGNETKRITTDLQSILRFDI